MLAILGKRTKHFVRMAFQQSFFRGLMLYIDSKLEAHLNGFVGSVNIPKDGPVIIVPNHQSYFDGFVITNLFWKLVDRQVKIPTNVKALKNPLVREVQVAGGAVPIDPKNPDKTYATITELLNSGRAVVMYPEGTRSDGQSLHAFKYGAFNLAVEHSIPILPVAVSNFSSVLPRGSLKFSKGAKGQITFGELIRPNDERFKGYEPKDVAHLIKSEVYGWIYSKAINQEGSHLVNREIESVSSRVNDELELLLDQNVELISKNDVKRVSKIGETARTLPQSSFDMKLQEVRLEGFRLSTMPKVVALLRLRKYTMMLNHLLREDKYHPYLNYCKGLLNQKLPAFYRKETLRDELKYFKRAYLYSNQYGYPVERFVHGLASSLYTNGSADKALTLLKHSFENPEQTDVIRQLRRRDRGLGLMKKIERELKQDSKNSTRPLQGFESFMAQSRISDVVIGQLEGIESFEQIREAAVALHNRHPNLRAKVMWPDGHNARPVFEFLPVNPEKVHVVERYSHAVNEPNSTPFWKLVAEDEVNHTFDLSGGYMYRVTWLPESGHIIINVQHSLVDGGSLMNLLSEFVAHCGGQNLGKPLLPTPSALEVSPNIGLLENILGTLHRESFLRARSKFNTWAEIKPQGRLQPREKLKTNCFFAKSSKDICQNVISECKSQGVTVGGAYAAAVQCAVLHFSGAKLGVKDRFTLPMDFSLRRYFEGDEISSDAIGYLSGTGASDVMVNPKDTFWDLAKSFSESAKSEVDMKSPLIFHKVFDKFWNSEKTYKKYNLDCAESGGAGATVTMSNVGRYQHDTQIGKVKLTSIYGMSASQKAGAMLYCWLRSVNDKFYYSFTSINPALSREYSAEFFGYVVFLMSYSTSESAKDKPIKKYIPLSAQIYKDNNFVAEITDHRIDMAA
ncbi:1-acyl-sn-glycerol-3-phosphate acyltransferase [Vibrio sp. 10N.261.46.E11]|uniref:1-acyl-sn-glycerol-3-phosphate acyltransferase n=1 Tax=Vibrio sp. 10N.261.46.E11 TaxID=3229662 RepID=UPI0035516E9C